MLHCIGNARSGSFYGNFLSSAVRNPDNFVAATSCQGLWIKRMPRKALNLFTKEPGK